MFWYWAIFLVVAIAAALATVDVVDGKIPHWADWKKDIVRLLMFFGCIFIFILLAVAFSTTRP